MNRQEEIEREQLIVQGIDIGFNIDDLFRLSLNELRELFTPIKPVPKPVLKPKVNEQPQQPQQQMNRPFLKPKVKELDSLSRVEAEDKAVRDFNIKKHELSFFTDKELEDILGVKIVAKPVLKPKLNIPIKPVQPVQQNWRDANRLMRDCKPKPPFYWIPKKESDTGKAYCKEITNNNQQQILQPQEMTRNDLEALARNLDIAQYQINVLTDAQLRDIVGIIKQPKNIQQANERNKRNERNQENQDNQIQLQRGDNEIYHVRPQQNQQLVQQNGHDIAGEELDEEEYTDLNKVKELLLTRPRCVRPSKNCPNRWTIDELAIITSKAFKMSVAQAKKMGYKDMCIQFGVTVIESAEPLNPVIEKIRNLEINKDENYPDENKNVTWDCITRCKQQLQPHQIRVIHHLRKNRAAIAVHSTGSGKTLTAVTAAMCFLEQFPQRCVMVVTPKSLVGNFRKEIEKYGGDPNDKRITIMGYDDFRLHLTKDHCHNGMLIVDEAHNLKTLGSKGKMGERALSVTEYAFNAIRLLFLTATPIVNDLKDLQNILTMCRKDYNIAMLTEKQFEKRLASHEGIKELCGNLFSFYSPDEQALKKYYPNSDDKSIYLEMDKDYLQSYENIESGILKEQDLRAKDLLGNANPDNYLSFYHAVRAASNALDKINSPKIKYILDMIKNNPTKKFVIYSNFRPNGISLIVNHLKNENVGYREITGSESADDRTIAVNEYNNPAKNTRILIITKAGGEGLDLKFTDFIILLEPTWNIATEKQIKGRGIRYKSHWLLDNIEPANRGMVEVHHLILVKPFEYNDIKNLKLGEKYKPKIENENKSISVDLYIKLRAEEKQKTLDAILNEIKKLSIDK